MSAASDIKQISTPKAAGLPASLKQAESMALVASMLLQQAETVVATELNVHVSVPKSLLPSVAWFCDVNGRDGDNEDCIGIDAPFYAVVDGHGGLEAARYTAFVLPKLAHTYWTHGASPIEALTRAMNTAYQAFNELATRQNWTSGACVAAAMLDDKAGQLHVAWAGDCEVSVVQPLTSACKSQEFRLTDSKTQYVGKFLTPAHWPHAPDEQSSLQKREAQLPKTALMYREPSHLVCGLKRLAVSRSIGDTEFQNLNWDTTVDITSYTLQPGDKYAVLTSDGLYNTGRFGKMVTGAGIWPIPDNKTVVWGELLLQHRVADYMAAVVGPHDTAAAASDALFQKLQQHPGIDNVCGIVLNLGPFLKRTVVPAVDTAATSHCGCACM